MIIDRQQPQGVEDYGAVIVEYADGEQVNVKHAGGPEYGALSVTIGAGRLLEGAWADLTEWFQYYGVDGTILEDWYSPTESATYAAPPLFQWPVAAANGSAVTLGWVEGPDWNAEANALVGTWSLVFADATTVPRRCVSISASRRDIAVRRLRRPHLGRLVRHRWRRGGRHHGGRASGRRCRLR